MIRETEAPLWRGLGRLNVAGNRICTATLISADEVVTSAHCLFHPVTRHRAEPAEIHFVAGFWRDDYAALRHVTAIALLPDYVYTGQKVDILALKPDLALLKLDQPISPEEAQPLKVIDWPGAPARFDIAGYGRDRPLIPSIREGCGVLAPIGPGVELDCPVVPGLSGAPVVVSGGQELAALVSVSVGTRVKGESVIVIPLAPHLAALRALLPK